MIIPPYAVIGFFTDMIRRFAFLPKYMSYYMTGVKNTLILAFFTVLIGCVIGIFLAMMKVSRYKVLKFLASCYIEFIRGTPVMLQVAIIYYGIGNIPSIPGVLSDRMIGGILALSINSGAYVAEIFRAGIQAIDKGQEEAARSLGMTGRMSMMFIILPQAVRNVLPALGNEFIVVIKESAVVSVIGVGELMYQANTIRNITFKGFEPLIVAAVMYFILTFTLSKILGAAEHKMRPDERIR